MNTVLLISLFFCHFLADFTPLSTPWMLNAKRLGTPIGPILAHACVHGLLMWGVLIVYLFYIPIEYKDPSKVGTYVWFMTKVSLLQIFTHFLIDLSKGRMNVWFPFLRDPANKSHWVIFGLDQFFHAVVIIVMVVIVSI